MTPYEIPLSPEPQSFQIQLAGVTYGVRLYWCKQDAAWKLDLSDTSGTLLIGGKSVVTGCDLLGQYAHLGFGGSLVAQTDYDPDAVPAFGNLGTTAHLYFITEP